MGCDSHFSPVLWADSGEMWLCHHPAIQEFHDVERCPYHTTILAKAICFGYGHVCILQGMNNAVFSVDLVGCLGQQLARRLLSHDIFGAIGRGYLICWI